MCLTNFISTLEAEFRRIKNNEEAIPKDRKTKFEIEKELEE